MRRQNQDRCLSTADVPDLSESGTYSLPEQNLILSCLEDVRCATFAGVFLFKDRDVDMFPPLHFRNVLSFFITQSTGRPRCRFWVKMRFNFVLTTYFISLSRRQFFF